MNSPVSSSTIASLANSSPGLSPLPNNSAADHNQVMESNITQPSQALIDNWPMIKTHFYRALKKTSHVAIATVRPDGTPHISPVGSFFLNDDCTGYYLEKFTTAISKNAPTNPAVTVLGVDPGMWFWLKSLYKGQFARTPAIRLYGTAGEKRAATEREIERFLKRVRPLKRLKGYAHLWEGMGLARIIHFHDFEPARLGKMTQHLKY